MAKQLVMDQTGHSVHEFDSADKVSLSEAQVRFDQLTKDGYLAAVLRGDGSGERDIVRKFDPAAEDTLFIPRLKGG